MTEKFRDMDIFCKDNRKMLLFNQFDLGAQYEIFTKHDDVWRYNICFCNFRRSESILRQNPRRKLTKVLVNGP